MWIVKLALARPYTFIVLSLVLLLICPVVLLRTPVDIFMKTRRLGQSSLEITRIGIRAWAIGGGQWEFGRGPQNDRTANLRE